MSYTVEEKLAPKNSYFTPSQSNAYYAAKYARNGITLHWWGNNEKANQHDNIVNYFLLQGKQGIKSVNYVVSDNKITMMVDPSNVAWASQAGNPTTVSIECQPTLGVEGYKRLGWLIHQLEVKYKKTLTLYPHKHWTQTTCPGTISLPRARSEANKWKLGGAYNPKPKKTPVKVTVKKNWGLSSIAKAAHMKDWFLPSAWARISKLNGYGMDWRKMNKSLKPGRKVTVGHK